MNKKHLVIIIVVALLFITSNKVVTMASMLEDIDPEETTNLTDLEYASFCSHFVSNHFGDLKHCYFYKPLHNTWYTNMWELEGECMPCHIHSAITRECLKERFSNEEIKTTVTSCVEDDNFILIHYYNKVNIDGEWVTVDSYEKKRGVPFGKHICEVLNGN